MKYVHFSGLSNTPWVEVASAIRLKRIAANRGAAIRRRPKDRSLIEQLANTDDEDLVVIGYQPAAVAIATALAEGVNPSEGLELWVRERDSLLKAVDQNPARIILFDINEAASKPHDFVRKLSLRTGLVFSSRKSVNLPDVALLDRDLAERFLREGRLGGAGHGELDHAALVAGRKASSIQASDYWAAVMAARAARDQLTADTEAFVASLSSATEAPANLISLPKKLAREKLAKRDDAFGALANAIQAVLRAQKKEEKALAKTARALTEELETSRAAQELIQNMLDEVTAENVLTKANLDGFSAAPKPTRDVPEQLLGDQTKVAGAAQKAAPKTSKDHREGGANPFDARKTGDLLVDVLEVTAEESIRRDEEIALLRELLAMGFEIVAPSINVASQPNDSDGTSAIERARRAQSSVNHSAAPSHVVLSRKLLRNPAFWIKTGLNYWMIKASRLFDSKWYLRHYPELAQKKSDPVLHYLLYGGLEGRPAGPHFCSAQYMEHNPDVRETGLNPLVHYLRKGRSEGRQTYRPSL